jgi:hypothetical protein
MFKTVEQYFDQHDSVWNGRTPLAAAVQEFKTKIEEIDAAAQKQETPLSGATEDKAAARDELEDDLFLMCEALGVLAHTSNDHDLEALVDVSPSILLRLGDEEISNRATNVLARANAKKTELEALQVTQANIDELEDALQAFQAAKAKPRTAVVERSVQTQSLSSLVREANSILRDRIDRLVKSVAAGESGVCGRVSECKGCRGSDGTTSGDAGIESNAAACLDRSKKAKVKGQKSIQGPKSSLPELIFRIGSN